MANLENINAPEDIHLDIQKTYDFIDEHLPKDYSREVLAVLPDNLKVSRDYIRRVKTERIKNAPVMIALYRVAQWHKFQNETKTN